MDSDPTLESKEELLTQLKRIKDWEQDQSDLWFWEKIGRIPFLLLDKITPQMIHNLVGKILDEIGGYIQTGGQYLISEKSIIEKLSTHSKKTPLTLEEVAHLPLTVMNQVAEQLRTTRSQLAAVQGATTGFGGVFTLAIDIPAVLGLSLKVLQEMAISYGYNPQEKQERIFIVKCLHFASADIVGKQSILKDLSSFCETNDYHDRQAVSQVEGWREVIANYRDTYGWKKIFQIVPIIGIFFGAWINRSTIQEVAETGQMLYQKRRVLERLKLLESDEHQVISINK
ncbi:EcsC family protein [Hazenella coriacea]|uniref:EcsC family protein n=1 Tax=Hazenella coriacea TaxID=1179467 RepID=A0A4R3L5Q3_9BACL|nr:EcsC family protein [Hazenella coriacea]TCS93494.1 EcsC family protein [Hazenella coriacea]